MFRCESILLKSYWILVLMDVFTRRIIGFDLMSSLQTSTAFRCGGCSTKPNRASGFHGI
jgi:hypothetical protein